VAAAAWAGWGGPSGSAQNKRIGFLFFSEIIFNAKTNPRKSRICLQSAKNAQKISKNSGKFPKTPWDMSNPNKVFEAHEKDFKAL
jgi:hypothetical protein